MTESPCRCIYYLSSESKAWFWTTASIWEKLQFLKYTLQAFRFRWCYDWKLKGRCVAYPRPRIRPPPFYFLFVRQQRASLFPFEIPRRPLFAPWTRNIETFKAKCDVSFVVLHNGTLTILSRLLAIVSSWFLSPFRLLAANPKCFIFHIDAAAIAFSAWKFSYKK